MHYSIFLALVGLVTALLGQVVENQVPISTVTAAAHPMTFWPLSPLASTATPISYGSPPQPSRVPPLRKEEAITVPDCTSTLSPPRPSPVSTSLCTIIEGSYPTSTLPSFCRPTLFANAPDRASPSSGSAVVTIGANSVADKVSCCAECAAYYNCFAWRFLPAYVETPTERLPGGFDPWRHGGCEIAYHTGDTEEIEGEEAVVPSVCPNGLIRGNGTEDSAVEDDAGKGKEGGPWFDGLYYNGWNEGACGGFGSVLFLGGGDVGIGDESSLCGV
ncbi:hypothetical protein F4801DRAFT_557854 [Xylaria longipes]|nr:hypothetical protein F4801DRAFT_557854 [Xylaria longipes]RYC61623.1 hypothetical protein CHU98_g4581 [Xylaria longipes]